MSQSQDGATAYPKREEESDDEPVFVCSVPSNQLALDMTERDDSGRALNDPVDMHRKPVAFLRFESHYGKTDDNPCCKAKLGLYLGEPNDAVIRYEIKLKQEHPLQYSTAMETHVYTSAFERFEITVTATMSFVEKEHGLQVLLTRSGCGIATIRRFKQYSRHNK